MASDSDLPHWIGDLPDPSRPAWRAVPWWHRGAVILILLGSALLSGALLVTLLAAFVRLFRWVAWGAGCGLLLLALTPPADAWEIRTQGPVTITGEGPLPILVTPPGPTPPVVVVPPPPPPPIKDPTPFVFPTNCPTRPIDAAERTVWQWDYPGDFQNFYAYLDGTGNPLTQSHTCAGLFDPAASTPSGKSLKDCKLWVPRAAGTARPWDIRCVLATGRVCP